MDEKMLSLVLVVVDLEEDVIGRNVFLRMFLYWVMYWK
jgi:hypothetical protein